MLQKPGKSDHVYTPTKLAAIIDTVVAGGVSPTHALAGVGVSLRSYFRHTLASRFNRC